MEKAVDKKEKQEMDIHLGTVSTDSFSMDYCRFGSGKGTLVILPGVSVQSVMPLADAIAEEYRLLTEDFTVYVFDRRKDLPDPYSIRDMADDTAEAMRCLGLEKAAVFGASQGGMIAMETAIHYPELVSKLIIGSSAACVSDDQFELFDRLIKMSRAGDAEKVYMSFGEAIFPADTFEMLRASWKEAAAAVTPEELKHFAVITEALRGFDITGELDRITCPALVIGSKDDKVFGEAASAQIAAGLRNSPDCQLYMYDGYGHVVYDLAPDYRERMLRFLI